MKQVHLGILVVSFVVLLLLGLFTVSAATTPDTTPLTPLSDTISGWLKVVNVAIVNPTSEPTGTGGASTAPLPSAAVALTSSASTAPGEVKFTSNVTVDKKNGFYDVIFTSAATPNDYFCIYIDPKYVEQRVPSVNTSRPALVCFYNPDRDVVFTNSVDVELGFADASNKQIGDRLDCFWGAGTSWNPSSNQIKDCSWDASSPDIPDMVRLQTDADAITYSNGSFRFAVKMFAGPSTFPLSK